MSQTQAGKVGAEAITVNYRLTQWFPELNEDSLKKLKDLHGFLLLMNRTINLIGVKTIPHADLLHFADSILGHRVISTDIKGFRSGSRVFDFGSGNGFPGLIFAILSPDIQFTLIDHDQRKIEYLDAAIDTLGLKNCKTWLSTIEKVPGGSVDIALVRDLANISKVILSCKDKFLAGGRLYHFKGDEWSKEVAEIPSQLCSLWSPSLVGEYKLPMGEWKFAIVKTEKLK